MTVVKRGFGQSPSLKDSLTRGKEFTDEAMRIDIQDILTHARYPRRIGHAAAQLSGVRLQLEGDGDSKRLVSAAYDALYDVMTPSLLDVGAEATIDLFQSDTTHRTLTDLSRTIDSYTFSALTHEYRTQGSHFHVTDAGLEPQDGFTVTKKMEARRGGCPYAQTDDSPYFNKFSDHIVETYAEAHRLNMPHGWLQSVSRFLIRQ